MKSESNKKQFTTISRTETSPKIKKFLSKPRIWMGIFILLALTGGGGYLYYRFGYLPTQTSSTESLQTAVARQGDLSLSASGTGTLIPVKEVSFGFTTNGKVVDILVSLGDKVEAGQLLAKLDDSIAITLLEEANQTLIEMTSPLSIAVAEQAVATAEQALINSKIARYAMTNWYDEATYQEKLANLVLATATLERAQDAYDKVADEGSNSVKRAEAYKVLFNAQQAYDTARFYVSVYSSEPSPIELAIADANLALAQAAYDEAVYYLTALTGGELPENATGSNLIKLNQTKENVEAAKETLDATNLYAPISGTIMSLNVAVGDNAGTSNVITLNDLSTQRLNIYLDESDWDNLKVGYLTKVTFDSLPDIVYTGKVVSVDPSLYTQGMTSAVHGIVELDTPKDGFNLLVGMSAAVEVISAQAMNTILIPIEALREISTGEYAVFVMENGIPTMRTVTVGILDTYYAEILTGLKVGETVTTGIVETK
jgi:HlyD family secretion protein